jgi:hypothetical protein
VGKTVMKSPSWLNFLVFICFLVIGYSFSARFYAHGTSILPETPRVLAGNETSIDSLPNGQRSLLIISTSSINPPNSQLESIWLASYIPSEITIRIMPVYPSSNGQASVFEDQLRSTFKLTRSNGSLIPDPAFMETLQSSNYWWSGYFIFDAQAVSSFSSQVMQTSPQSNTSFSIQENGDYLEIIEHTNAGRSSQLGLLQSACQKFFKTGQGVSLSQLLSLLTGHYLTNLQPELVQQEWDSLYSGEQNPTCRFPTLEISRLEP